MRHSWLAKAASCLVCLVCLVFGASLACCRQIVGFEDRHVPVETAAPATVTACARCSSSQCSAERASCTGSPGCAKLLGCLDACEGDVASVTACRIRCGRTLPTSFDEAAARVMACAAKNCAPDCALSCGGYIHPNALCEACAKSSCCAEATDCATNAACLDLTSCIRSCTPNDGPCVAKCRVDDTPGVAAKVALDSCIAASCAAPCYDSAWACLGQPTAPDSGDTFDVDFDVVDIATLASIGGVGVRFCPDDDGDGGGTCPPPSATTDDKGHATLAKTRIRGGCFLLTGDEIESTCLTVGRITTQPDFHVPVIRRADRDRLISPPPADGSATVIAFVHDCTGAPGTGVSLSAIGGGARTEYWRNGRFVNDAFSTDASGIAALVSLPAEPRDVRAQLSPSLPAVGQMKLRLRPDVISYVELGP